MSVWNRLEGGSTGAEQAQLARDVVEALRATPREKRARLARAAALPEKAHEKLGDDAAHVLGYFIDDDALREGVGWQTITTWARIDQRACVAKALARAAAWPPHALWFLVDTDMDASEVFDVLAPLYRANGNARRLFAHNAIDGLAINDERGQRNIVPKAHARAVLADARFVELALETAVADPVATCCLLGANASARAVEELRNMLQHARSPDEAIPILAGLELALKASTFVDVLAEFIVARGAAFFVGVPRSGHSMHPFANLLARMSFSLSTTALMRAQPELSDAVRAFIPPRPVG